eukprot:2167523-Amphidinium_carterae.1
MGTTVEACSTSLKHGCFRASSLANGRKWLRWTGSQNKVGFVDDADSISRRPLPEQTSVPVVLSALGGVWHEARSLGLIVRLLCPHWHKERRQVELPVEDAYCATLCEVAWVVACAACAPASMIDRLEHCCRSNRDIEKRCLECGRQTCKVKREYNLSYRTTYLTSSTKNAASSAGLLRLSRPTNQGLPVQVL